MANIEEITEANDGLVYIESSFHIEESTDGGPSRVKGWFGPLDKPNANGRLYKPEVFAEACGEARERIEKGRVLGQLRHPSLFDQPNPQEWCIKWTKLHVEDNRCMFEGEILPTSAGNLVSSLWKSGVGWLVSPRGRGTTTIARDSDGNELDYFDVVEYSILGLDLTLDPAFAEQAFIMEEIEMVKSGKEKVQDATEGTNGATEDTDSATEDTNDNIMDDQGSDDGAEGSGAESEEPESSSSDDEGANAELDNQDEDKVEDAAGEATDENSEEDKNSKKDEEPSGGEVSGEVEENTKEDGGNEEREDPSTNEQGEESTSGPDTNELVSEETEDPEEEPTMGESRQSSFDERTMSILQGSALVTFAESTVDGWISDGDVDPQWRDKAINMLMESDGIEDAAAKADTIKSVMSSMSEGAKPAGSGTIEIPGFTDTEEYPETIGQVIADSISRVPDGPKRKMYQRLLLNYAESHDPRERMVLETKTKAGREMLSEATYSNTDLIYIDFVLPIIERLWIELKGADLVATFPVQSPVGFVPKLGFMADDSSFYLEDYYYKYFEHTEGQAKKEAKLEMSKQTYEVEERAIAFEWSDNLAYDLQKLYGRDAESMLVSATAQRLTNEIDMHIVDTIVAAANASASVVNFGTIPPGTTRNDIWWTKGFQAHLTALETQIYENSYTHPNFILTGQNGYEMLMMSGDMITHNRNVENETANYGLNYMGTFEDRFQIYYTTYMPADTMVLGHKPRDLSRAGVLFLPYVLGVLTDRAVNPKTNTMERAIHSRYALERLNDEVYGVCHVWQSVGTWPF